MVAKIPRFKNCRASVVAANVTASMMTPLAYSGRNTDPRNPWRIKSNYIYRSTHHKPFLLCVCFSFSVRVLSQPLVNCIWSQIFLKNLVSTSLLSMWCMTPSRNAWQISANWYMRSGTLYVASQKSFRPTKRRW